MVAPRVAQFILELDQSLLALGIVLPCCLVTCPSVLPSVLPSVGTGALCLSRRDRVPSPQWHRVPDDARARMRGRRAANSQGERHDFEFSIIITSYVICAVHPPDRLGAGGGPPELEGLDKDSSWPK